MIKSNIVLLRVIKKNDSSSVHDAAHKETIDLFMTDFGIKSQSVAKSDLFDLVVGHDVMCIQNSTVAWTLHAIV